LFTPPLRLAANHYWRAPASVPAPCPAPSSHCLGRCLLVPLFCQCSVFGGRALSLADRAVPRQRTGFPSSRGSSFLLSTHFAVPRWQQLCTLCDLFCFCCCLCVPVLVLDLVSRQRSPGVALRPGRSWARGYSLSLLPPALISGEHLRICPQEYTCCSSEIEQRLTWETETTFRGLVEENGSFLVHTLAARHRKFDDNSGPGSCPGLCPGPGDWKRCGQRNA
uniref:Glypican 2 n=1 Tax=Sus scrofa TaxID=9823 RepID=A0A4X1UD08_PIG